VGDSFGEGLGAGLGGSFGEAASLRDVLGADEGLDEGLDEGPSLPDVLGADEGLDEGPSLPDVLGAGAGGSAPVTSSFPPHAGVTQVSTTHVPADTECSVTFTAEYAANDIGATSSNATIERRLIGHPPGSAR
jgi:hypothetical protein